MSSHLHKGEDDEADHPRGVPSRVSHQRLVPFQLRPLNTSVNPPKHTNGVTDLNCQSSGHTIGADRRRKGGAVAAEHAGRSPRTARPGSACAPTRSETPLRRSALSRLTLGRPPSQQWILKSRCGGKQEVGPRLRSTLPGAAWRLQQLDYASCTPDRRSQRQVPVFQIWSVKRKQKFLRRASLLCLFPETNAWDCLGDICHTAAAALASRAVAEVPPRNHKDRENGHKSLERFQSRLVTKSTLGATLYPRHKLPPLLLQPSDVCFASPVQIPIVFARF